MKYNIPSNFTLRDVYLMFIIANEPAVMLEENNLNYKQVFAFRTVVQHTWGDFIKARSVS